MEPAVWIEAQHHGYIRYWNSVSGQRTEVRGVCDRRLDCMVGAVVDGVLVETVEQAKKLPKPVLDCPVGPGFRGCCPLTVTVL